MKRKLLLTSLLLVLIFIFGACSDENTSTSESAKTGTVTEVETIYIGALLPQSTDAKKSKDMQIAMDLAVDIINNSHDIDWDIAQNAGLANYGNAKVAIKTADCGKNEDTAADATSEMIDMGVSIIVGATDSELTTAVAKTCALNRVPQISGSANATYLTDGSYSIDTTFNRIASNDLLETTLFLDYINQLNLTTDAGIEKVAIAYINNDYGNHAAQVLKDEIAKTDLEIVALIPYQSDADNLTEQASKMILNEPDAIFQISTNEDLIVFSKFYSDANYQPKVVLCYSGGFAEADFAKYLKKAKLNFYMGAMVTPDLNYQKPETEDEEKEEDQVELVTDEEETLQIEPEIIDTVDPEAENTNIDESEDSNNIITPGQSREHATAIYTYINKLYQKEAGKPMSNEALLEFASIIVAAQSVEFAGTTNKDSLLPLLKQTEFPAPYLYSGTINFNDAGQNVQMPTYLASIIDGEYTYAYMLENAFTEPVSKQEIEENITPALDIEDN